MQTEGNILKSLMLVYIRAKLSLPPHCSSVVVVFSILHLTKHSLGVFCCLDEEKHNVNSVPLTFLRTVAARSLHQSEDKQDAIDPLAREGVGYFFWENALQLATTILCVLMNDVFLLFSI